MDEMLVTLIGLVFIETALTFLLGMIIEMISMDNSREIAHTKQPNIIMFIVLFFVFSELTTIAHYFLLTSVADINWKTDFHLKMSLCFHPLYLGVIFASLSSKLSPTKA
jgi:hypothetical protein